MKTSQEQKEKQDTGGSTKERKRTDNTIEKTREGRIRT